MAKAFLEIPNASQNYVPPPSTLVVGLAEAVGGDTNLYLLVLENGKQSVMEKKQSLLKQTQKKLSDGKAINPINVVIESKNQGGFQTKILIRDHEIISDQPFGFNGQNKGPKPSELVLAALAACQETTYRIFAEDMGIEIGKISVQLKGTQDLRGFMALDDKIPAGFTNIVGQIFIQSDATEEELELLRRRVDQHCPVLDDLRRPVEVSFAIEKRSA